MHTAGRLWSLGSTALTAQSLEMTNFYFVVVAGFVYFVTGSPGSQAGL